MSRTIRRVPLTWQHPKDNQGRYIPLQDKSYLEALYEWQGDRTYPEAIYDMLHGDDRPPALAEYRPDWPQGEKLVYQVYSDVGEMGIPISPILPTIGRLLSWLIIKGYSRDHAHHFIACGSSVGQPDHLRSQFGKKFDRFGGK